MIKAKDLKDKASKDMKSNPSHVAAPSRPEDNDV